MAGLGTFTSGQVLTAAELNAISTWTAFTPSWTGISAGAGASNTGQYSLVNKTLYIRVKYVLGTGGSVTANPVLTVPALQTLAISPQMLFQPSIVGMLNDSGVASYSATMLQASTTTLSVYCFNSAGTYTATAAASATVPFTFGVNDNLEFFGVVQVA